MTNDSLVSTLIGKVPELPFRLAHNLLLSVMPEFRESEISGSQGKKARAQFLVLVPALALRARPV
jgi:hypothetical protein